VVNKELYRNYCKDNINLPIFLRDWWLDAVCGEDWDVLIKEEKSRILAVMPYYIHKKYSFKSILPPHLSPINGLWINYAEGMHQTTRYTLEIDVMSYFAKEIDNLRVDYFSQKIHHSISNWLGFFWNGFKQTTHYTYRINDLSNIDEVYQNIASKKRRLIKKAYENIIIDNNISNKDFYNILSMSFARQAKDIPYPYSLFERIEEECSKRESSTKLVAKDNEGNIHAVMYLVYDQDVCYTLASGGDPKYRDSGAMALLNWEAMRVAHSKGKKEFDFTGSIIPNIEKFFRFYGATLTPYYIIEKTYSKIYTLLKILKH